MKKRILQNEVQKSREEIKVMKKRILHLEFCTMNVEPRREIFCTLEFYML
jgi:hypothetical protein